jgi:formamidopyrimidine-DNA glycosylase
MSQAEAERMHVGLRNVLSAAIAHGGTTLQDYRNADGRPGLFGTLLQVYDREGEPCVDCGIPIERVVLVNRSAFYCPGCQPR